MRATPSAWRFGRRRMRNPLRRPGDVLEAWLGPVAVVLMLLAGPAVGWTAGSLAHDALRHSIREQHRHRHLVSATTLRSLPGRATGTGHESTAGREGYHRVIACWQNPDGTQHTGVVPLRSAGDPGRRFPLWTDDRGRVASRPMDGATASVHAVLAGIGAAAMTAGGVQAVRRLVVWRLTRRRYARWDRAWERAAHTWGRADAGS